MGKPLTIRRSLITSFAVVIMLLTGVLVGLTFVGAKQRAEEQSKRLLGRSMGETKSRLALFFQPAQRLLEIGRAWGPKAVDDGGNAPGATQPPAGARSPLGTRLCAQAHLVHDKELLEEECGTAIMNGSADLSKTNPGVSTASGHSLRLMSHKLHHRS